jgi:hypothetical protein
MSKPGLGMSAKKSKKDIEKELFRAEVQNYLKTGKSLVLTDKEKAMLDKVRVIEQPKNFFKRILEWFK